MLIDSIEIVKVVEAESSGVSITDFANIIVAVCSLCLTGYIFIYQKSKDQESSRTTAILNNQNLKLQWFKDLVIQPNLDLFSSTFKTLLDHPPLNIQPGSVDYQNKSLDYISFTKNELFLLRRNFLSLFLAADVQLYDDSITIVDDHLDYITQKLINEETDLSIPSFHEDILNKEIIKMKNSFIKLIYSYSGK